MKLSPQTWMVLKNFSNVNPNILVQPGNVLRTISDRTPLIAKATIEEEFPLEFGVFDLKEFLNCVALVGEPDLEFNENHVMIRGGNTSIKFMYAKRTVLTAVERDPPMEGLTSTFSLKSDQIDQIRSGARALKQIHLIFYNNNGKLAVRADSVADMNKSVESNVYTYTFSDIDAHGNFQYIMTIDQLVMIPDDYTVRFYTTPKRKNFAEFTSADESVVYWLGLNKESKYESE